MSNRILTISREFGSGALGIDACVDILQSLYQKTTP